MDKGFITDLPCYPQILHPWQINGKSFTPPSVPVLLQILSGAVAPSALLPEGSVIPLPANKTIEVVIPGGGNVSSRFKCA